MAEPHGRKRAMSDQELRDALSEKLKPPEIAERFGISTQTVYKRIKRLGVSTVAAVTAPEESRRFVERQIDAMEELQRIIHQANLLGDACDEWLRDAEDPTKYNVGARAGDMIVTYSEVVGETPRGKPIWKQSKAPLSLLLEGLEKADLRVDSWEKKHADPRELILKAAQERRQTVGLAADLMRMLVDARRMETFQEAFLAEVAKADPDVATRIAERIRSHLLLCATFGRDQAVSAGRGEPE